MKVFNCVYFTLIKIYSAMLQLKKVIAIVMVAWQYICHILYTT